jgi:hypothetical protein
VRKYWPEGRIPWKVCVKTKNVIFYFSHIINALPALIMAALPCAAGNSEEWCMDAPFTELRMQLIKVSFDILHQCPVCLQMY